MRPYDKPARERHILSVVCSCLSVILLVLALALQEWGRAETNTCKFTFKLTQVVIENEYQKSEQTYTSKPAIRSYVWYRERGGVVIIMM